MATASSSTAISRFRMSTSVRFRRGSVARRRCRTRASFVERMLSGAAEVLRVYVTHPRVRPQESAFLERHFQAVESGRVSQTGIDVVGPSIRVIAERQLASARDSEADGRVQRDGAIVVGEDLQADPLAAKRAVEPAQQSDLAEIDEPRSAAFFAANDVVERAVGRA